MKTISIIKILSLATLFLFTSCGDNEDDQVDSLPGNTEDCFDISFETLIQDNGYRFEGIGHSDTTANYSWSINGEFIENGSFDGINNEFFSYDFTENGTYTVCAFIETPECPLGVEYCEDIIVRNN